ncbi:MAG: hypothetical protein PT944_04050 [Actinomycetaceae bacterium]|nr:hypothetical protein [Arcanobacterium sp.]MDD7687076.1 hypothetical protein [Actinomycetaceae bacterium]MDY5273266.1 hypothetical protein [Arcanobacterium sp.]
MRTWHKHRSLALIPALLLFFSAFMAGTQAFAATPTSVDPIVFTVPKNPVVVPEGQVVNAEYVYKQLIAPAGVKVGHVDSLPNSKAGTVSRNGAYEGYLWVDSTTLPAADQYGNFEVVVTFTHEKKNNTKQYPTVKFTRNRPAPITFTAPSDPVVVPDGQTIDAAYVYSLLTPPEGVVVGHVDSLPNSKANTFSKNGVYRGYLYVNSDDLPAANAFGEFPIVVSVVDEKADHRTYPTVTLKKNKPAKPEDKVVTSDWSDATGADARDCEALKVKQTRTTTTTTHSWSDEQGAWVEDAPQTEKNEQLRDMTEEEKAACSAVTPTPEEPEQPGGDEPEQPAQPEEPAQPAQPAEPVSPTPAQPTQPEQPSASAATPTQPKQPAQPDVSAQSQKAEDKRAQLSQTGAGLTGMFLMSVVALSAGLFLRSRSKQS